MTEMRTRMEDDHGRFAVADGVVQTLHQKIGVCNLPRQRRLIPSSLALCLPDLCTLLNPTPEASLRPVPTLSGLPFASRSSVAGSSCVPVLSLQTLATADLLYAVPLLLGRLHGDETSAASVLGPLGMQVHGKRDVRRCLCAVCAHDVMSCEVVVIV